MCNSVGKRNMFSKILHTYKPDLLLLQEDMIGKSFYPVGYRKVAGLKSNEGLMNTILVKESLLHEVSYTHSQLLPGADCLTVDRTASIIVFRGLRICNLHLSGGRNDDILYKSITHLRDAQVAPFADCDIVVGDFNGNPGKFAESHPVYLAAGSQKDKVAFREYFSSGHRPLTANGMLRLTPSLPTDVFGGNPDHLYYNPKRLKPLSMHLINTIQLNLSDHNGIYLKFQLFR
jgi:endonuclease/exonuclease/phosphatase family metal-dependent hydrolase